MEQGTPQSEQFSRDAWVAAALGLFESGGPKAVWVDSIAKSLQITRGSFYWHFANRADLLNALLERWTDEQTKRIISENEAQGGAPRERLLRLLKICAADDGRLELGIRDWAKEDGKARAVLQGVDKHRTHYLARLIEGCGLSKSEAEVRANLVYLSWLGLYSNAAVPNVDQRIQLMVDLCNIMISRGKTSE
ncbi:TetR/AcrR family transcriptional regulator [uncultured Roseobacter sp.]|uniref:TetR/AcrR family transcriptional regulator n=1 Tax=uncultured Roseobacter sp. TaxID=114847 RepID=UPI002603D3A1|nr:TetR/AcrR family transcriptional regulator [uncultured Roseobacter sp.]